MGKNHYYLHVCTVPLDGSGPTSSDDLDVLPKELKNKKKNKKMSSFLKL